MSFRVSNTHLKQVGEINNKTEKKEKNIVYTQEEIDLIDEKYKEKEKIYDNFSKEITNPLLDEYRKKIIPQQKLMRESIIYDSALGKWKTVKEEI
jgi:hypothetical protein